MLETLLVAAIAVGIVLVVRPGVGLGVLIAVTLLWPEYVRVPMGVVQMSAPRFVAMALVIRYLGRWSQLKSHPADWLVLAAYFLSVIAVLAEGANTRLVNSTIGRFLDTALIYAAARLCLATYEDVKGLKWPLLLTALGVGSLAGIEAVSKGFIFERYYFGVGNADVSIGEGRGGVGQTRWGMMRAQVATAHPIYFGVACTILLGLSLAMRRFLSPALWWSLLALAAGGVFFCLSSGPWTAAFLLVALLPFARWTWLVKPALGALVLLCIALELATERHFYYLICYIGLSGDTAWYRVRLLEVAFLYLPDYWLFGYGDRSWEHWGLKIDGRFFIDCVNNYIYLAAMHGVFTMLAYLGAKVAVVVYVVRGWKRMDRDRRWTVFALTATVLAVSIAENSVSIFGPALIMNALLLGATASAARWAVAVPAAASALDWSGQRGGAATVVRASGRRDRPALRNPEDRGSMSGVPLRQAVDGRSVEEGGATS
jgi:hypothetical protein